ncbi:hypothetical protein F4561_005443 [Lipingzhangella halophila]|uniref:Uncharacterized protein n=1 Tax=Lipingzhangella halophila TaxID=1783352 RepID=A0A7W7RMA4_9ACTN|nr:hypothetical protein [Lipingzhangella halophila]MBB4934623.1 hypothetical protein [Lipingzhangella halophila]
MTDGARPESAGLTAVEKYDLDHHLFRHRFVWALGIVALTAAGFAVLTVFAASERFHRFDAPVLAAPACWTAAVLSYAFGARRLARHRARARVTLTLVLGLVVALAWPPALAVHLLGDTDVTVEATAESPDGRHTLVAESYRQMVDPSCRVWLRENSGPLSRQTLVWERFDAPCPESMTFAGNSEIRISSEAPGAESTTTFDADTMRVARSL